MKLHSYLFYWNYEKSTQNNQCAWCSSLMYEGTFYQKKAFHEGPNVFWEKIYGEVVLNRRANDQIMPKFHK